VSWGGERGVSVLVRRVGAFLNGKCSNDPFEEDPDRVPHYLHSSRLLHAR